MYILADNAFIVKQSMFCVRSIRFTSLFVRCSFTIIQMDTSFKQAAIDPPAIRMAFYWWADGDPRMLALIL